MAPNFQHEKTSNKVFSFFICTILASIFVGALLAWIIFQMGFGHYFFINSLLSADSEFKEPIEAIREPSKLSFDTIESWKSWMKMDGLFRKVSKKYTDHRAQLKSLPMMKILYWNDLNDESLLSADNWDGSSLPLEKAGCPIFQCKLINRLNFPTAGDDLNLSEFDAIIFRYNNINEKDLPRERWPNQRYIFYEQHSPMTLPYAYAAKLSPKDFFNLTMTHRWDSDIVAPIGGWVEPASSSEMMSNDHLNYKRKSKMIALLVDDANDCPLASWNLHQRELIEQLKKYEIQVDIIRQSDCTRLESIKDCEKSSKFSDERHLKCRKKIAKEYAFYFAMEEHLCLDYITEKFYSMLDHPIIPLVTDVHDNYAKAAPPRSYINALDFPTVGALADYLTRLYENPHLYKEYFEWKKYFKVGRNDDKGGKALNHLCNLCAALHETIKHPKDVSSQNYSYKDNIADWWIRKADCTRLGEFEMVEVPVTLPL